MDKAGLYIHIPFCRQKCKYCDFNSYDNKMLLTDKYIGSLIKEINMYSKKFSETNIDTIFIGGGTPSILKEKLIYEIINSLHKNFSIDKDTEFTIESNPSSLSFDKLKKYKKIGINRLSIGLQSCIDEELKALGRIHNYEVFEKIYCNARESGFENINVDLMFSIPKQTKYTWEKTVKKIAKLSPEHISCYSLTLEEDTILACEYEKGTYIKNTDFMDRKLYEESINILKSFGYHQYEISNFSKPGYRCEHNIKYWKCEEYLGFGAGAHSYMNNKRYSNIVLPEKYMEKIQSKQVPVASNIYLTDKDRKAEYVMLGFRMAEGINLKSYKERFNKDFTDEYNKIINKYKKLGLIELYENRCKLTLEGFHVSNTILADFI